MSWILSLVCTVVADGTARIALQDERVAAVVLRTSQVLSSVWISGSLAWSPLAGWVPLRDRPQ